MKIKYKCNECDNEFSCHSHLQRHITSKHKNIRHKCNTCNKSYTDKDALKNHVKKKHANFPVVSKKVLKV